MVETLAKDGHVLWEGLTAIGRSFNTSPKSSRQTKGSRKRNCKREKGKVGTGRQGRGFCYEETDQRLQSLWGVSEVQAGGTSGRRPRVVLRESRYSGELGRETTVQCWGAHGECWQTEWWQCLWKACLWKGKLHENIWNYWLCLQIISQEKRLGQPDGTQKI